jgi:hypothetical protein
VGLRIETNKKQIFFGYCERNQVTVVAASAVASKELVQVLARSSLQWCCFGQKQISLCFKPRVGLS